MASRYSVVKKEGCATSRRAMLARIIKTAEVAGTDEKENGKHQRTCSCGKNRKYISHTHNILTLLLPDNTLSEKAGASYEMK